MSDDEVLDEMEKDLQDRDEVVLYVPFTEEANVSVWAVDPGLQMFTNIPEETASILALDHPAHLYFFAELSTD